MLLVLVLAAASVALHLVGATGYDYGGAELYYIVASDHLDWGYADHGPLVAYLALAGRILLGTSVAAVRVGPALAGGLTIIGCAWLARRLGAGRRGMRWAALASFAMPSLLAAHATLSPDALTPLLALGGALIWVAIVKDGSTARWPWLGALAGLAYLNDPFAALLLPLTLVVALVVGQAGTVLRLGGLFGIAVAGVLVAPNLGWRASQGLPMPQWSLSTTNLEGWVQRGLDLAAALQPAFLPLVIGGMLALLLSRRARAGRALGGAVVVLLGLSLTFGVAMERLVFLWPIALAAGAAWFEAVAGRVAGAALVLALLGNAAVSLPFVVPVLPVDDLVGYAEHFGGWAPRPDRGQRGVPERLAEQLGWAEQVDAIERAFVLIDPRERSRATIWAASAYTAAAVDVLGERYGMPAAMCGERGFRAWGPQQPSGDWLIAAGVPEAQLEPRCRQLREVETFSCDWCLSPYRRMSISLCELRR